MKTYEETYMAVLRRRSEAENERKKRNRALKRALLPAACCLLLIMAGIGLWRGGVFTRPAPTLPPNGTETPAHADKNTAPEIVPETEADPPGDPTAAENAGPQSEPQSGTAPAPGEPSVVVGTTAPAPVEPSLVAGTTAPAPEGPLQPDDGSYGGDTAEGGAKKYFCVPILPKNREIVTAGEAITEEEAAAYFAEHKTSLASALAASGVAADDLRVSPRGYGHVGYTGAEGERLTVRQNFRDYLVYNGDTLVAIVTLVKENGQIYGTPSFGAAWFADYGDFLNGHRGEELVYVYAGSAEIILTPDGGMYSTLSGIVPEIYLEGVADPYRLFYHPGDVYVP